MLKFLGIVFLVIIVLVVALFTWLFFKMRSSVEQQARAMAIEEGISTTPSIVLEPVEHFSLVQPELVAQMIEQIMALGAASCGKFDAPAAGARLSAFVLESPPVYIVVYDHDQVDPWTDVVLRLDQDRSFTASTVPEIARGAPRHPDEAVEHFAPGTDMGVLVRAAAEHKTDASIVPATADEFKAYFEATAEKSRQYIQTQTVSQEWLETIADDAGVELLGGEAEQINLVRDDQQVTQTASDCFKSLAQSGDYTAAEWDDMRDHLVAVWDDMPGEYVADVFYGHVDWPEEPEDTEELESSVDLLEEGRGRARERVAELNAGLPEDKRLILIGTVSTPVEADIYRDQLSDDMI